jgi:hypothetical protein
MRTPRNIELIADIVAHCAGCRYRIASTQRAYCTKCYEGQEQQIAQMQREIDELSEDAPACPDCDRTRAELQQLALRLEGVMNNLYHAGLYSEHERDWEALDDVLTALYAL